MSSRLPKALLAGAAAAGLTAFAIPAAAHGNGHPTGHKTTAKATGHAPAHATTHVNAHAATHVNAHATLHETKHATVHQYEGTHAHTSARYTPVVHREHAGVERTTVDRIESESTTRFREMARTPTPVSHVTLQREGLRSVAVHHAALSNAHFVTGTVVSRSTRTIVVRTQTGNTVTVLTQAVPIVTTAIVPGTTIVLPVQYTGGQVELVPTGYTIAQQTALANEPMLAPCAINDNDADDAGDTSYYAPPSACYNNDGDADDGYGVTLPSLPALPSSFGQLPQFFSSSYAPAVASGFVVTQIGSNVLLMTPNFKPLIVNAGPAFSNGTMSGQLSPGQYVVAYGYNVNNTFVATTLM